MKHVCTRCGRSFKSNSSLDKHARSCRKKWPDSGPLGTRPHIQGPEDSRGHKRPRPDEDVEEQQGPSNAYENTTPLGGSPPGSPTTPVVLSKRSGRPVRLPRYLRDYVPHGDMSLAHVPPRFPTPPERDDRSTTPEIVPPPPPDLRPHPFQTRANKLGVFRRYTRAPTWIPKHEEKLDLVSEVQPSPIQTSTEAMHEISRGMPADPFAPFPNISIALYMATYFSGKDLKSEEHATSVAKIMQDPRFSTEEMKDFNAHVENVRMDKYLKGDAHPFQAGNGWQESTVDIRLPVEGTSVASEVNALTLPIRGMYHRRITDIIRTVCKSKAAETFHFTPYTMHWRPDPLDPDKHERVYADTYNADVMIQTQTEIDSLPRQEGDTRERIALGIMLASDSTQLTNFGSASVWPVYLMFANQPKKDRVKPSCHAVHHLAYVPSLGGDFASRYQQKTEKKITAAIEVHCKRELMHAVWDLLLDGEFVEGSVHGIVIRCSDDTERVFFPRIITYSADYPEKTLLATIKNLGNSPCPRCLIQKKDISGVGTRSDARKHRPRIDSHTRRETVEKARRFMFNKGLAITSKSVKRPLDIHSMVPTRNAFSDVLTNVGQDYHDLFVVDLLHEFEIGVWKSVLTHLLRMLYAIPGDERDCVALLNARFHSVPTFFRDTIRQLPKNVSDLSKLAARDYEDLLQCAIPAFDGLFPEEDDRSIKELLFLLATWHAYAKLRLHTDTTLEMMKVVVTDLCQALRNFTTEICPRYTTRELPKEARARVSRQQEQASRGKGKTQRKTNAVKDKRFNMNTFKIHCIPDYVDMIRKYGTTDSYSTQISELAHILSKIWYRMSNKNRDFVKQMTDKETRARFYDEMMDAINKNLNPPIPVPSPQPDAQSSLNEHYYIPKSATVRDLAGWLSENQGDPALRDFRPRLLDHLYSRIKGRPHDGDEQQFSTLEHDSIVIDNNRIYHHKTIRFRSTTYDARRIEEPANPHTHADIMVLSHEDGVDGRQAFPYWHARIVGIYHFMVCEKAEDGVGVGPPSRMDVLLVRWLGFDSPDGQSGWGARQLHKVGFLPDTDEHGPAFGFLDPNVVLRMVHLIPDFSTGRTKTLLTRDSIAIQNPHDDGEYSVYYVAMFSDRDLFMRYRGGGVGHLATRQCNQILLADKHTLRDDISDGDEDLEPLVGPEGEEDGQPEGGGRGDGEEDGQEDVQEDSDEDGDDDRLDDDDNDERILEATDEVDMIIEAGFDAL